MTERYLNLNGDLLKERLCGLSINNRAFKYGDGLFETIRVKRGKALFLEDHFSRMMRAMEAYRFDVPTYWDLAYFKKEIVKVIEKNELFAGGRVRVTIFRKGEGYYVPKTNEIAFIIEAHKSETNDFLLNDAGLKLGIYDEVRINANKFSSFKTNNCLPYISAGMWARDHDFDEVILLNDQGNIVECVSSNIFILVENILYTPSIEEGPTAGIMRKKVIQMAKKINLPVIETAISPNVLTKAEEIFTSNSIAGLKWIGGFEKNRYFHRFSQELVKVLNEISD